MSKYANSIMECEKKEIVVAEYEAKIKAFNEWFIQQETEVCSEMLRNIQTNFTMGNSIYPSQSPAKIVEFIVRRHYMDAAIGSCYALKQEIQYILHTLPVDVNKFERFAKSIDKQINLLKGVKQADNRFIKNRDTDSIDQNMIDILSKISAMSSKLLDNNLKKLLSSDEQ